MLQSLNYLNQFQRQLHAAPPEWGESCERFKFQLNYVLNVFMVRKALPEAYKASHTRWYIAINYHTNFRNQSQV